MYPKDYGNVSVEKQVKMYCSIFVDVYYCSQQQKECTTHRISITCDTKRLQKGFFPATLYRSLKTVTRGISDFFLFRS